MKKYEVQGVIGMGAYGVVLKAVNKSTKENVAIKKFKESDSNPIIRKIALREVKALKHVNHPNLVKYKEAFRRDDKLNIVFEYVPKTVLEDIEQNPQGLSPSLIQSYMFQLLQALHYLHKNDMIHRDVKPENLLVSNDKILKLCDFGFARRIGQDKFLTGYVATRWYRSPELLLSNQYNYSVDIWAAGCVMAEMIDGQPLFPGDDTVDQIFHIVSVLGNFSSAHKKLFNRNKEFSNLKFPQISQPQTLEKRYQGMTTKKAIDLLNKLLAIDEKKRYNASQALMHPYFADLLSKDTLLQQELFEYQKQQQVEHNKENINKKKSVKQRSVKKSPRAIARKECFTEGFQMKRNNSKHNQEFQNLSFYKEQNENFSRQQTNKAKKSKTLQPKKIVNNNTQKLRQHSKLFNKANSTNFIIKKMFNFGGTFYNQKIINRSNLNKKKSRKVYQKNIDQ